MRPDQAGVGIEPVRTTDGLAAAAKLFREYASSLDIDLAFQGFEAELAAMPGAYAPPDGELLLARASDGRPAGCVGLRPMKAAGCCEMKRLYVSRVGRGSGLGKALVEAVIREAERIGYREIRLDTLPSMKAAVALYLKSGFEPIEPYYETPVRGTVFLGRPLTPLGSEPGSLAAPELEAHGPERGLTPVL